MMEGGQLLPLGHILASIQLQRDSLVEVSSSFECANTMFITTLATLAAFIPAPLTGVVSTGGR